MSWKEFALPKDVQLDEQTLSQISTEMADKIKELTGEAADSTLVEFIQVMLSAHSKFGEIATQLLEVNEGEDPEPLCSWLVNCVKRVAKLEPSAEEQLAAMRAQMEQLEADKRRLEEQLSRPQEGSKTKGISLAELRKRKNESSNPPASLAITYREYLESGFQGDFCAYEDSLLPIDKRMPRPVIEEAAPSEPRKPGSLTWQRPGLVPEVKKSFVVNPVPSFAPVPVSMIPTQAGQGVNQVWINPNKATAPAPALARTPAATAGGNLVWTNPAVAKEKPSSSVGTAPAPVSAPALAVGSAPVVWGRGASAHPPQPQPAFRGGGRGRPAANMQWVRPDLEKPGEKASTISQSLPQTP
jgi:hypothetical protein